ncbi:hypothetical protein ACWDTP_18700 [Mycobacterium sp. NPDC003449]
MTVALALLIMVSPFAVAAALSWAAHRSNALRIHLDQFRVSAPMMGRLFDIDPPSYEVYRAEHDIDAIRTRFESDPVWPSPGVLGERR